MYFLLLVEKLWIVTTRSWSDLGAGCHCMVFLVFVDGLITTIVFVLFVGFSVQIVTIVSQLWPFVWGGGGCRLIQ